MSSEEDMSDLRYGQVLRKSLEVKDVRKYAVHQQPLFPFQMNSAANLYSLPSGSKTLRRRRRRQPDLSKFMLFRELLEWSTLNFQSSTKTLALALRTCGMRAEGIGQALQ